ncbi:hypothetical protein VP1G_10797 [Cytospora mali]|uniref:Uncharacterized protein n=1 Tax=Cytospora mali TaxID=578113 RepID=A0A194UWF4_CYTMA|nr:hypothetical protein VP1G_10797 [Valsa mali var. pyri (nom. inval.)]
MESTGWESRTITTYMQATRSHDTGFFADLSCYYSPSNVEQDPHVIIATGADEGTEDCVRGLPSDLPYQGSVSRDMDKCTPDGEGGKYMPANHDKNRIGARKMKRSLRGWEPKIDMAE